MIRIYGETQKVLIVTYRSVGDWIVEHNRNVLFYIKDKDYITLNSKMSISLRVFPDVSFNQRLNPVLV